MRRCLAFLFIAGLLSAPVSAGAQSIRGTVVDDATSQPIAGVHIEARSTRGGGAAAGQTNADGAFLLHVGRSGPVTLTLTHVAYTKFESDTLSLLSGETLELALRMGRTTIPLEPVTVTARSAVTLEAFQERMRRGSPARFVTRADIDSRPAAAATDLLRVLPGVEIVPVGPPAFSGAEGGRIGARYSQHIYLRGGPGRCEPTIFLDGMLVEQLDHISSIDELIQPGVLEGIEVHIGTNVPSPLFGRGTCGVVAFWSRRGESGSRFSWKRVALVAGGFIGSVVLVRLTVQ